jgi:ankyrin repeat protein
LNDKQSEMRIAVASGNMNVVQCLHENGVSIDIKDEEHGTSLLHIAAYNGRFRCVEFLLAKGIGASVKDNLGRTPLHQCGSLPFTPDRGKIFKVLLAHGANLTDKSNVGNCPLIQASAFSDPDMIQFLLSIGADVNATSNDKSTPLHFACHNGKVDNAFKLLDHGADLGARNSRGRTPLDVARNQTVVISIIVYQFNMNRRLRQELHNLRTFVIATTIGSKLDLGGKLNTS